MTATDSVNVRRPEPRPVFERRSGTDTGPGVAAAANGNSPTAPGVPPAAKSPGTPPAPGAAQPGRNGSAGGAQAAARTSTAASAPPTGRKSTMLFRSTGLGKAELLAEIVDVRRQGDYLIMEMQTTEPVRWRIRGGLSRRDLWKILRVTLKWSVLPFFLNPVGWFKREPTHPGNF